MYKLKPGKYLNPVSDVVFKNLMKDSDNMDYLAKIISIVTKLDYDYVIDNIVLVDTDTLDNNVGEHHNTGDLVVNIDDTKINIEASLDNKKINKRKMRLCHISMLLMDIRLIRSMIMDMFSFKFV